MRILNAKVFDEVISGTTSTWLSRSDFNRRIGQADGYAIQAITTGVKGNLPTLTVTSEHSADGQNWIPTGQMDIDAATIGEDGSVVGTSNFFIMAVFAANLRFRIALGGTSPGCRLKLYVTGRFHPL